MGSLLAWIAPSNGWLDTSTLATSSFFMGVAHPPGEPLYNVIGKAFTLLPVANIAFRTNCLSALFLALSLFVFFRLIRLLSEEKGRFFEISLFAGLYFFLSFSLLMQGVRTEVYSLNLFLSLLILYLLLDRKYQASCFLLGLSLGCHPLLSLIFLPAVAIELFLRRARPGLLIQCALFCLVGLSIYIYLPLRAVNEPIYNFGDPKRLESFMWVVKGSLYKAYSGFSMERSLSNFYEVISLYSRQISPLILLFSSAGLVTMLFRRTGKGILLLIIFFADLSTILVNMHFDPANPDANGYLMFSFIILAIGLFSFVMFLYEKVRPFLKFSLKPVAYALLAFALLMCAFQTARFGSEHSQSKDHSAFAFARSVLEDIPYGSLVITGSFSTFSVVSYAVHTENLRSDLKIIYSGFMENEGYLGNVRSNYPDILPDFPRFRFDLETLKALRGKSPVFIELAIKEISGELGLRFGPPILDSLCPVGWFFELCPSYKKASREYTRSWEKIFRQYPFSDIEFKKHVMLGIFLHSQFLIYKGDKGSARWLVAEGSGLNKDFEPFKGLKDRVDDLKM